MSEAVSAAPSRGRLAGLRFAGDDRLTQLAAAGDPAAFAAIYRRYHRDLSRYLQAILGNPEQAEDALQNTMVSALRALPGERREIVLKPWLYRVAHNEAISILRQRRNFEEIDPELAEPDTEPQARVEAREGLATLIRDLDSLPDRQRGALVMRELSDLSYAEIAAAFDLSEGAARQTIYEARKGLLEMAEGREMDCAAIRAEISADDRRVLRGRRLRAHLRGCDPCREFEVAIKRRRAELAQIAPLAPAAATAILHSILGSSAAGGSGALGAAGAAGGVLGGSAAVKSAVAVIAVATAGVGAADLSGVVDLNGSGSAGAGAAASSGPASEAPKAGAAGDETRGESNGGQGSSAGQGSAGEGKGMAQGHGQDKGRGAGNGSDKGRGTGNAEGNGHAHGPGAGNGVGATGIPPSQAQTPPSQAQSPPGHGQAPPEQGQNPSAQGQAPLGQGQNPPSQAPSPLGQGQAPAGQAGAANSQSDRPDDAGRPGAPPAP